MRDYPTQGTFVLSYICHYVTIPLIRELVNLVPRVFFSAAVHGKFHDLINAQPYQTTGRVQGPRNWGGGGGHWDTVLL